MDDVEDMNAMGIVDHLAFKIALMQVDFGKIIKLMDNIELSDGDCLDAIEIVLKKYRD